jgi:hypothetical protein
MRLPKVHSFSSYNLSESKKRMGLSVNEDEVDDLADDIKGPAAKKTEAPKEAPAANDDDLPDDIKAPVAKKSSTDTKKESPTETKKEADKKTSVSKDYKINMGLGVSNKSNKLSYSAYVTLFIEALNSLDRMAGLGVEVDPDAPAIKNYESDRLDIATSVGKTAGGLKNAWDKIYQIAGAWPPSGEGITGIIKKELQKNDVINKYKAEKKALDAELNGTPKLKKEEYDKQLAEIVKKYSAMIDPKKLMTLGKINNAIGLYKNAIDKFRQGADAELGFVEKREGGIKGEDLAKVDEIQKQLADKKTSQEDKIRIAEKLKKDFPAYFGGVKTEDILGGAIDQIKSGLAEAPENFYEELSDAIAGIVLSKKPDDKKEESENWIGNQEKILEDFGGFLANKKAFVSGVGKGIVDGFKGGPKDQSAKSGDDKASLLYAADVLKGSLVGLASEIDNVVAFKKNIQGLGEGLPDEYFEQKKKLDVKLNGTPPLERDDYVKQLEELKKKYIGSTDTDSEKLTRKSAVKTEQEAKAEASEMISFVKDSFKYVVSVPKELESSSSSLSSIKSKLDDISKQIAIIGRKGGTLEKWKNDVLGESRERIASTAYLEKGRELMQMAAAKAAEVTNQQAIEKRYRDRDADVVFKKAVDMFKGGSGAEGALPSKIKRKGDVAVFSKDAKEKDKATVKSFQQRLIDLGHLPTGNLNGEFDEQTKNASKLGMTYIGSLSGKVYADNEEAFQDFQRDLGFYSDNKDEIKKKMGL